MQSYCCFHWVVWKAQLKAEKKRGSYALCCGDNYFQISKYKNQSLATPPSERVWIGSAHCGVWSAVLLFDALSPVYPPICSIQQYHIELWQSSKIWWADQMCLSNVGLFLMLSVGNQSINTHICIAYSAK